LAVDVGSVRVGVARSDPDGVLASPLEVIAHGRGDLDRLAESDNKSLTKLKIIAQG